MTGNLRTCLLSKPAVFYITGNFVPCDIKTLRGARTAAERQMSLLRPAAGGESCFAGFFLT
ncbi:hypothetical protein DW757_03070 [Clostridium sp. AM29-11AC]|nr:hypothetical protein DW757_03070 [Clostridium sp. AM29-11AC]